MDTDLKSLAKRFPTLTQEDLEQLLELSEPEIYHNLGYASFDDLCKEKEETMAGDLLWELNDRRKKALFN